MKMIPEILVQGSFLPGDIVLSEVPTTLHLDALTYTQVQEFWEREREMFEEKDKDIWDGISFRLESCVEKDGVLFLTISKIPYSVRRGLKKISKLRSLEGYEEPRCLSVATVLKTADGWYVMGRRNEPNRILDLFGGVVDEVSGSCTSGEDLFLHLNRELQEEVGILPQMILSQSLRGILWSGTGSSLFPVFSTELFLFRDELQNLFLQGHDDEMVELIFFGEKEFFTHCGQYSKNYHLLIPELFGMQRES